MRWVLGLYVFALVSCGCATSGMVQVGRTYAVVWSYSAPLVPGPMIAHTELLTIDALARNGWVQAHNPNDPTVWWVRIGAALALIPYEPAQHQAKPTDQERAGL